MVVHNPFTRPYFLGGSWHWWVPPYKLWLFPTATFPKPRTQHEFSFFSRKDFMADVRLCWNVTEMRNCIYLHIVSAGGRIWFLQFFHVLLAKWDQDELGHQNGRSGYASCLWVCESRHVTLYIRSTLIFAVKIRKDSQNLGNVNNQ